MKDSETDATIVALHSIRCRLTVAFLAVELLCRNTASFSSA